MTIFHSFILFGSVTQVTAPMAFILNPAIYSRFVAADDTMTRRLLYTTLLLVFCQIFYEATAQQCKEAEYSKFGMMLRRHIFKRITGVSLSGLCMLHCYEDVRCQSFNWVISRKMCELNNRTKEARPEDYVPDSDRLYLRRDQINRGLFYNTE